MARTDFEDEGGSIFISFGENSAGTRYPVLVDNSGQLLVSGGSGGTADLGKVGSYGTSLRAVPTVTSGTAYAANENVGERLEFTGAARNTGGGGVITDVVFVDGDGQDKEIELWLFDRSFTAGTDKASWSCGTADLTNIVGVISSAQSDEGWVAAGTPSVCTVEGISLRYDCNATSLFGRHVTRSTPTFTTTASLKTKIGVLQD